MKRNTTARYAAQLASAFFLITTAAIAGPLTIPPGGAQVNFGGCATVTATTLSFFNTACTTANIINPGAPDTGSYAGLTSGTILNLTGGPNTGVLAMPVVDFLTFMTGAGLIQFDLTTIYAGTGTLMACGTNTVGNICTPTNSPFTLTQSTASSVSISFSVAGLAYLGASTTGTSPTTGIFTTQNLVPGTITSILAAVQTPAGFQDTYSANFASLAVPEPGSMELMLGAGLIGMAFLRRRMVLCAAALLACVGSMNATQLITPAQSNIGGCAQLTTGAITFFNTTCVNVNTFDPGGPNTGSYAGLTGGTIQKLTTLTAGTLATPVTGFTTFNTGSGTVSFDLTSIAPGNGTAAGCGSNAVGSVCTQAGSSLTLMQVAPSAVSITLGLFGQAYLGSSATGTSPTNALFTSQSVLPGTISGVLAALASPGGLVASFSATYSSVSTPTTCPTNPLLSLTGTWTFYAQGFVNLEPYAIAGQFTATVGASGNGLLTIPAATSSRGGNIARLEDAVGTYQVNAGCGGGILNLYLSSFPISFEFYVGGNGVLVLESLTPGVTASGSASLVVNACPANFGGTWSFSANGFSDSATLYSSAGQFTSSMVTITSNRNGQTTRDETGTARITSFPNCSGGTLFFAIVGAPRNFDFWFNNGGGGMVFIGTDNGSTVLGTASRM